MAQAEQLDLGQRGGGGRTRARVEEGQLTDQLAGAEHGEHVLPAVGGGAVELHLALGHHIEPVARVALVEEGVAARERGLRMEARSSAACSSSSAAKSGARRRTSSTSSLLVDLPIWGIPRVEGTVAPHDAGR